MTAVDELRHRWNRYEYELLDPDAFRHTELIDGEILDMAPMSARHAFTIMTVTRLLVNLAGSERGVSCQTPIVINDHSEPEPDIWVSRRVPTTAEEAKPGPAELLLVVEVADSSLTSDKKLKVPLYARAEIQLVWLLDVGARTVTVYAEPVDGTFSLISIARIGENISVPWGGTLRVDQLFIG
jgi:Uma2 family endonuclease